LYPFSGEGYFFMGKSSILIILPISIRKSRTKNWVETFFLFYRVFIGATATTMATSSINMFIFSLLVIQILVPQPRYENEETRIINVVVNVLIDPVPGLAAIAFTT
jgi:hypothetical protein